MESSAYLSRDSFYYKDKALQINTEEGADLPVSQFLEDQEHPLYLYNKKTVLERVRAYKEAFSKLDTHIHFAVKSNPNPNLLTLFKSQGVGADVVSQGEMNHALEQGIKAENIIFSGVGKTKLEIEDALSKGVGQINCESLSEVKRISKIGEALSKTARIGVRINPDISVDTHPYIATGFRENKFGIPLKQIPDLLEILQQSNNIELIGISCHIGSQIMDSQPLHQSAKALMSLVKELAHKNIEISTLDIGGGLGVDYHSDDEKKDLSSILKFGEVTTEVLKDFPGKVFLEPGRSLVARSGILLTRVEYIKSNGFKNFVVTNTGMHHLLRPSLYQAYHKIVPVQWRTSKVKNYDVVGPICESSDVLGYDRNLPEPEEGDWLAILDAGAYGSSMVSQYNMHPFPTEVLI